jgi:hypothetical protein
MARPYPSEVLDEASHPHLAQGVSRSVSKLATNADMEELEAFLAFQSRKERFHGSSGPSDLIGSNYPGAEHSPHAQAEPGKKVHSSKDIQT